jgi:hypothetical protein
MSFEKPSEDLTKLLPKSQYKTMMKFPESFENEVKRMNEIASKIPKLYETDEMKQHPLSLHYFVGGSAWYIAEWDKEEDIFFGYAILNNDLEMSEWGYISREEIISLEFPAKLLMINLDLYCDEEFIEDALFKRDPKYFKKFDPSK